MDENERDFWILIHVITLLSHLIWIDFFFIIGITFLITQMYVTFTFHYQLNSFNKDSGYDFLNTIWGFNAKSKVANSEQ